jgi:hypothetical protein
MPIRHDSKPSTIFQNTPTWLVGLLLLGAGAALLKPGWLGWLAPEPRRPISDALLVAGLLTLLVDPFIKGRLYKEVSAGTFQYLLGFAQPPEIQEAMRKLAFETKGYARDLRMNYTITREDENSVRLRVRSTVRVENPTAQDAEYEPFLAFEEAERPEVEHIVAAFMDGSRRCFPGNLKPEEGKPEVLTHHTDRMILGPRESITVEYRYSLILPEAFFHHHYFGTRTIGVTVFVDAPGLDQSTDLDREHRALYMIGDHITVRWKPSAQAQN